MLTQEQVSRLLSYDERSGVLTWIGKAHPRTNDSIIGKRAGTLHHSGARQIRVNGRTYLEHSIIWLLLYGYIPKSIDHINMVPNDNRLVNLRECSHSQNMANRTAQRNNKLGIKGVCKKSDGHYLMSIKCGNYKIQKTFGSVKEAKAAYTHYSRKLFGEFARIT